MEECKISTGVKEKPQIGKSMVRHEEISAQGVSKESGKDLEVIGMMQVASGRTYNMKDLL